MKCCQTHKGCSFPAVRPPCDRFQATPHNCVCAQPVADAPDGLQELRAGRVVLELFADAADVDGDGDVVAHRLENPDHLIQILPAEHLPRVAHEKQQKLVFPVLERELHAVFEDLPRVELCRERAHGECGRLGRRRLQPLHLRQMRLHARDEHARGKRLFDIVVRTASSFATPPSSSKTAAIATGIRIITRFERARRLRIVIKTHLRPFAATSIAYPGPKVKTVLKQSATDGKTAGFSAKRHRKTGDSTY